MNVAAPEAGAFARWAAGTLLDRIAPAGHTRGARLATAELGGRHVLLAELESAGAKHAVRVAALAEARGANAIVLASGSLEGVVEPSRLTGSHVLIGPDPRPGAAAHLAAAGFLTVALGPAAAPVLAADGEAAGLDLAALLLGYLPSAGGAAPVYAAAGQRPAVVLEPSRRRNALAALHTLADDALRLLPSEDDALVLALLRIEGRTVAAVAPQRLAADRLDAGALARLVVLVRLAARACLPLLVLGEPQEPAGDPTVVGSLLVDLADATIGLRRTVLLVDDDAPASAISTILDGARHPLRLHPRDDLRDVIAAWLG